MDLNLGSGRIEDTAVVDAAEVPMRTAKKASIAAAVKLLPKLVEAFSWGQQDRGKELAEQIATTLEDHHADVAKGMRRYLGRNQKPMRAISCPDNIVSFEEASHGLDGVILSAQTQAECQSIIDEHSKCERLAEFGLKPRHLVLLHGAPGNGKTLLAEALAYELGVPFLRVKYGGLVESYMGASAKNIDTLMEYAAVAPCVIFADEFDGIGMARDTANDIGEAKRITNQLLIALERLPSHSVFVAATNVRELMDAALLRRFDFVVEIPQPTSDLVVRCAELGLNPAITPGHDLLPLVDKIADLSPKSLHEVVELCKRLRRDLVLNDGKGADQILEAARGTRED